MPSSISSKGAMLVGRATLKFVIRVTRIDRPHVMRRVVSLMGGSWHHRTGHIGGGGDSQATCLYSLRRNLRIHIILRGRLWLRKSCLWNHDMIVLWVSCWEFLMLRVSLSWGLARIRSLSLTISIIWLLWIFADKSKDFIVKIRDTLCLFFIINFLTNLLALYQEITQLLNIRLIFLIILQFVFHIDYFDLQSINLGLNCLLHICWNLHLFPVWLLVGGKDVFFFVAFWSWFDWTRPRIAS